LYIIKPKILWNMHTVIIWLSLVQHIFLRYRNITYIKHTYCYYYIKSVSRWKIVFANGVECIYYIRYRVCVQCRWIINKNLRWVIYELHIYVYIINKNVIAVYHRKLIVFGPEICLNASDSSLRLHFYCLKCI